MTHQTNNSDLFENLAGVWDIMLGRVSGKSRMNLSASGIGWSFAALAIAGLVDMSALSLLYDNLPPRTDAGVSKSYYIIGHIVIALIGYSASIIALFLLCRTEQEQRNFPTAVAVHNWAAPVVSLFFLPLLVLAFSLGGDEGSTGANPALNLISVFWIGVLIFIGIRLIRISLDLQVSKAVAFFILTAAVSLITTEGLESLIGLTRPS